MSQNTLTHGWDIISAMRIDTFNKLVRGDNLNQSIQINYKSKDGSVSFQGAITQWLMVPGGNGDTVRFDLTIQIVDGNQFSVRVQVKLDYYANPTNNKLMDLKVRKQQSPFTFLEITGPNPSFNEQIDAVHFTDYLNSDPGLCEMMFCSVDLSGNFGGEAFSWMHPTSVSYAYIEKKNPDNSYVGNSGVFAILGMTDNRQNPDIQQVDGSAIPNGQNSSFIISKNRFLDKLLFPNVYKGFPNSNSSDFTISPDTSTIMLKDNMTITFSGIGSDGKEHSGTIISFTMSIEETDLLIQAITKSYVGHWTYVFTQSTHRYNLVLRNYNGKQSIGYQQNGTPTIEHWKKTDFPWYAKVIEVGLLVIGIIASVVLTVLTSGLDLIIGLVVIGLLVGIVEEGENILNLINTDKAPDLGTIITQINAPISWMDEMNFNITDVHLNDSLIFSGEYE